MLLVKYSWIGLAIGLLIGAMTAAVFNHGYEMSDSVIGTGMLGAAAGWVIGNIIAGFTLMRRWLRGRRTGQDN
ncbi:hypothetical protein AB0C84_20590 [Actinomadura sp. NPDC048955]|uniref:hypothetical protein n=1 Tax=Actinomadura sp. NPDC048955 TaxID=3158228 RepID=UPI0033ED6450